MAARGETRIPAWIDAFLPAPPSLRPSRRAIAVAGAFLGILVTALLCSRLRLGFASELWLMAPLGASAAQMYSLPSSPMSQPWPVVAGHALSALSGLIALHLFGQSSLAAAVAVALAVALMIQFRALHPSGGGTALFVVVSQTTDWRFILFPVTVNTVLLVATAMAWHRATGQAYPKPQRISRQAHTLALHRFDADDLEAALRATGALDISPGDARRLIEVAELEAFRRMASGLTCGQIMVRRVHTVDVKASVRAAEHMMARYDVNALPVTDDDHRVLGLLRMEEARAAADSATAGEVMLTDFFRRDPSAPATDLIELFEQSGRRYVLVFEDGRLAGLIARSDLMAALFHAAA